MEAITEIVLMVFAILNLILFFKLWGATNNIKEMKSFLTETSKITKIPNENLKQAELAYLEGDKNSVEKLLYRALEVDLLEAYHHSNSIDWKLDTADIFSKYSKMFAKLGVENPDYSKYTDINSYLYK